MSYDTIETSSENGRPVELLRIAFSHGEWFYTTAEVPVVYITDTYLPAPFTRDKIQTTGDATKSNLVIRLPHDIEAGELFRIRPPSEVVTVNLFQQHYEDSEFRILWKGRVTMVNWEMPWLELTVENVFTSLLRGGLRRRYSVQCTHVLFEGGCRLNKEDYKLTGVVDAISGSTLSISEIGGAATNYYAGGFAVWTNGNTGAPERMMIQTSTGGSVTLSSSPIGLSVNESIDLYPGCSRILDVCVDKFGNDLNFGGTPFIPTKNPFDGTAIY